MKFFSFDFFFSGVSMAIFLVTAFLLVCFCDSVSAAWERPKAPNIVLINVDDLGWMDLACQGSQYYKTPNIDRLSDEGMRFTQAYAAASNCAPSRACMLTGQYSPRHGVYTVGNSDRGKAKHRKLVPIENTLHITDDNLTIGHLLQSAGYRTATIGKWHVSKNPLRNGFDRNIAGSHIGHPMAKLGGYYSPFDYVNCKVETEGEYLTDRLTDEAIKFVRDNQQSKFFLYFPFYTVHSPLQPRKDKLEKWKSASGSNGQQNAAYAAMIESLDDNVGRLLRVLNELSLDQNTVVIFTSDNGGVWRTSHQTPLRSGKGSYFEGGIRVPLIVRWPEHVAKGTVSESPVSNVDFLPTVAEIAGVKIPESKIVDGESLLTLITGSDPSHAEAARDLFWHFPVYLQATGRGKDKWSTHDKWFRTRPGSVIRSGDWKLHEYFEDGRLELYDLKNDVGETRNVAESNPKVVSMLHEKLKRWREQVDAPVPTELNPKYIPSAN